MAESAKMKPIEEVYPETKRYASDSNPHYFSTQYNYDPMLQSLGFDIMLQVDDNDYQGDSRLLFRDGNRIGHLNFGWGSCSGCDSLQACGSLQEIDDLRSDLYDSIRWFDSASDALRWFNEHDWEGDYSWRHGEAKEFVAKAKEMLAAECEKDDENA